jgi:HSP20 family protein
MTIKPPGQLQICSNHAANDLPEGKSQYGSCSSIPAPELAMKAEATKSDQKAVNQKANQKAAKWNPKSWEPLNELEDIMEKIVNWSTLRPERALPGFQWIPRVDICESNGDYLFKADVPGLSSDDLTVSLRSDILTIEGERKQDIEESQPQFHRLERTYGRFIRSFSLPDDADAQSIQAHCENGLLTITIAKKASSNQPDPVTIPIH